MDTHIQLKVFFNISKITIFAPVELLHWSITMKNSKIRTVAISLPNFQAIRITV